MANVMSAAEFMEQFGNKELKYIDDYKGTKRYEVVNDPSAVVEFVTKTLKYAFTQLIHMEIISYYIRDNIKVFNNDGDTFTVYRVVVDRR